MNTNHSQSVILIGECLFLLFTTTHQLKAPVWPEEEGSHEGGEQSTEENEGRTAPKA